VDAFIEEELRQSHGYGGRSVFGDEPPGSSSDAEVYFAAKGKRQQTAKHGHGYTRGRGRNAIAHQVCSLGYKH
jgi:hypothetical protein